MNVTPSSSDRAIRWHQCVHEIDRIRKQLRGADNDPAGVARVARDGAGILAAWSVALEGDNPGALARASRQLARSAELRAYRRLPPARPRPRSSKLALYLLAGARPDSTAGWFLAARQMSLLGRDLARLHQLRGDLDRARELETNYATELDQVHEHLTAHTPRRAGRSRGRRGARAAETAASSPTQRNRRATAHSASPPHNQHDPGSASTAREVGRTVDLRRARIRRRSRQTRVCTDSRAGCSPAGFVGNGKCDRPVYEVPRVLRVRDCGTTPCFG